jgi:hypothetical protein
MHTGTSPWRPAQDIAAAATIGSRVFLPPTGINTGPPIIATLHELGFNKRHVGLWLHEMTGDDSESHHWWRDDNGRYHCHDVT